MHWGKCSASSAEPSSGAQSLGFRACHFGLRVQALLIYGLFPGEVLEGDLPPSLFGVRRMVPFRIDRVYIIPLGFLPFVS